MMLPAVLGWVASVVPAAVPVDVVVSLAVSPDVLSAAGVSLAADTG